jgi:hypothetical protein
MQISRQLLLACAVAMCLTPALLRAYDNEAQIRARQALEEKMNQLETQGPQTNSSPPAVVTKPAPAKKPKKAPAKKPQPAAETPAPPMVKSAPAEPAPENPPAQPAPAFAPEISQPATPMPAAPESTAPATSSNAATREKLREALHEKMNETPAAPVAPMPAAPVAKIPAAPATPAPAVPAPAKTPAQPAPMYSPAPITPANSANNEQLQQALDEKMKQNEAATANQPPAPMKNPEKHTSAGEENQAATKPQPAPKPATKPAPKPAPTMSLPQLTGPASPLSPAKQQKLDALLQLYRADQLTPEQYHEQRAKILSEP